MPKMTHQHPTPNVLLARTSQLYGTSGLKSFFNLSSACHLLSCVFLVHVETCIWLPPSVEPAVRGRLQRHDPRPPPGPRQDEDSSDAGMEADHRGPHHSQLHGDLESSSLHKAVAAVTDVGKMTSSKYYLGTWEWPVTLNCRSFLFFLAPPTSYVIMWNLVKRFSWHLKNCKIHDHASNVLMPWFGWTLRYIPNFTLCDFTMYVFF